MSRFRPFAAHPAWVVAAGFVAATAVWFVLARAVVRTNDRFVALRGPEPAGAVRRADVEGVRVMPGSSYFFTWGVTASARSKTIAQRSLPDEERFGDTYIQAHSVLATLTEDLAEVGLTLRDVVNVRAYVVGDETAPPDFAAWDRAFFEFFGTRTLPHVPARTTVGISRLFLPAYRIEVEFVAVFPDGRGPFVAGSRPAREHARSMRIEPTEDVRSYGRRRFPMSTGKALAADRALAFSSAFHPAPNNPAMPERLWLYPPIAGQSASLLTQAQSAFAAAGLEFRDVFFLRTIVFPERGQPIGRNFAAFNREYLRHFNHETNPNRPTRTVMSAPGYAARRQLLAIEMYGLYPRGREPDFGAAPVKGFGPNPALASEVVAVSPAAPLLFLSAVSAPTAGDIAAEASAALAELRNRLVRMGSGFAQVAHLRAYLVVDGELDPALTAWRAAFASVFGTESQPHKPALTTLPVVALPDGRRVLLEVIAAAAP
jgi:enamine deaminase RidA (YjgF/YER057c/UK114 family)